MKAVAGALVCHAAPCHLVEFVVHERNQSLEGTLVAPSSYFMKSPPQQIHDDIAFNRVEAFIRGEDNDTLVGNEVSKKHSKALANEAKAKAVAK